MAGPGMAPGQYRLINRDKRKALRDLLVLVAAWVLLIVAERAADLGVPVELQPVVSAAALWGYRELRSHAPHLGGWLRRADPTS